MIPLIEPIGTPHTRFNRLSGVDSPETKIPQLPFKTPVVGNRNRLGRVLDDMMNFQESLKVERNKIPAILTTNTSFQKTAFGKFKEAQGRELDKSKTQFQVNVTTKYCSLTSSKLEFEKRLETQLRQAKQKIEIFPKTNFLMIPPVHSDASASCPVESSRAVSKKKVVIFSEGHVTPSSNIVGKSEPAEIHEAEERRGDPEASAENSIKIGKTGAEKSEIGPSAEASSFCESGWEYREKQFEGRLKGHLFQEIFFYNVKLNRKEGVIKTLNAHLDLIHARDQFGNLALHYAVKRGYHSLVRLLVSVGAPVDALDNLHMPPIAAAFHNNDLKMLKVQ